MGLGVPGQTLKCHMALMETIPDQPAKHTESETPLARWIGAACHGRCDIVINPAIANLIVASATFATTSAMHHESAEVFDGGNGHFEAP
jgi:hypothetical protein